MINGLKQLQNLSFPQRLIKTLIIRLFRAKIKLGQGARAAKTHAIENLYKQPQESIRSNSNSTGKIKTDIKTKYELDKLHKHSEKLKELTPKDKQILADELHKPFRKPTQLRKINFRSKDNIWNADLVMMPVEDGYKYILTVLDGYTRYAWAVPLKHKDGLTVSNAFQGNL